MNDFIPNKSAYNYGCHFWSLDGSTCYLGSFGYERSLLGTLPPLGINLFYGGIHVNGISGVYVFTKEDLQIPCIFFGKTPLTKTYQAMEIWRPMLHSGPLATYLK